MEEKMKRVLLTLIMAASAIFILEGCAPVSRSQASEMQKSVVFAGTDFEFGEIVTLDIEKDDTNKDLWDGEDRQLFKEYLIGEVLAKNPGYDTLFFPRFTFVTPTGLLGKPHVIVIGRLAKLKK